MNSPDAIHAPDPTSARVPIDELGRVRNLTRAGLYGEALAAARNLSAQQPNDRDALYLLAVNQRCLNLFPDALATLARLEQQHPQLGRLYQERGFCHLALRDPARAIAEFQRGLTLNPALIKSWSALENLYRMTGNSANAAAASEQLANLQRLPAEIVQAGSLFSEREYAAAETLVRKSLLKDGKQAEALRLLARIEQRRDSLDAAERLLESALDIAPGYYAARLELAQVLIGLQKYSQARKQIAALRQVAPDNPDYRALHATVCAGLGDHESAITGYRELLAAHPAMAHLYLLLGHSLKAVGRRQEAIQAYHAALDARPGFGDAYWSLANLKTYRFSESQIARMQEAVAAAAQHPDERLHLHFALGRALEAGGRYEESWRQYECGNALKRTASRYRPEFPETNTQRQIELCTRQFFTERAAVGARHPDPIFIVGLPRSGSTLIEQILASHSLVEGTQELNNIPRIVQELQGQSDLHDPKYPGALLELDLEDFRRLGERYLSDTRVYRRADPALPYFIDKMPNNFRHVGLIHLMLPNAKIIDVRREPMACCFGNLKQLFAGGQDFSYDMKYMARYYRTYLELMRHWDQVLPCRVHRIIYEDLVDNLDASVRRLLEFCGLGFESACLEFHKTSRSINTASSEQVRQPISREGLEQWTRYRPWLRPLEDMLGDALIRYRGQAG
jgi:tetratricopeptide (TPR) repeat protein